MAVLLTAGLMSPLAISQEPSPPCPDYHYEEGVGNVCQRMDGLVDVYTPDGIFVGSSHGMDPPPQDGGVVSVASAPNPKPVACVSGAAGTYYAQLIYARASNDADDWANKFWSIVDMANIANAYVNDAGVATGNSADIKVRCDANGVPIIYNQALPTQLCCDSFSTIVNDLTNQGFNDPLVHYWVFYDDTSLGGGQGHVCIDDSAGVNNCNNGNAGQPFFSVDFGWMGVNGAETMLHELGHNMGAVQNSAPSSTGGLHCWDGLDIMCYNDGGPNGNLYSSGYCPAATVFDCDKDDYFNASPGAGSYLATHWNIGATYNRYLQFGKPRMDFVSCPASIQVGRTIVCNFMASDPDSGSVYYEVNWGDGQVLYTGWLTPGNSASMGHSYTPAYAGARTITVRATDPGGLTSDPISTTVTVTPQNAPVMQSLSCPSGVLIGSSFSCTFRATDDSNAIYYAVNWGDGQTLYTGWLTPGATASMSHTYSSGGTYTVSVTATDDGNPQMTGSALNALVAASNDNTPPSVTLIHPAPQTVYRGCATAQAVPGIPRPIFVRFGCMEALITDGITGVGSATVYLDGVSQGTLTSGPWKWEFPVVGAKSVLVSLTAVDNAGNSVTISRDVTIVGS